MPGGGSQEGRGLGESETGGDGQEEVEAVEEGTWVAYYKGVEGVSGRVELTARDETSAEAAWEQLDVQAIAEAIKAQGKDELHLTRLTRMA